MKIAKQTLFSILLASTSMFAVTIQQLAAEQISPSSVSVDASPVLKGLDVETGNYRNEVGEVVDHNGSTMLVFRNSGYIVYKDPKSSIAGAVKPGAILFKGSLTTRPASGTAFLFKTGCAPAAYHVTGIARGVDIKLAGQAPVRIKNSCEIDNTARGKTSTLNFTGNGEFAD